MPEHDAYDCLYSLLTQIPDPRSARGVRHPLPDVLFIILVAVLAGAEDAEAIEDIAKLHEDWFRKRCHFEHGIPSQDTYLRILAALDPEAFGAAFEAWVAELWALPKERHIAIDGKTLRRSFDRATARTPVHSIAAFASERGLVLGQVSVAAKENEIVAIPRLLQLFDLSGAIVTIDAMGCQTAIAREIVERGGHYILQLKANQPTLRNHVASFFEDACRESRPLDDPAPEIETASTVDAGHGRLEERSIQLSRDLSWVERRDDWAGLSGIARIERRREDLISGAVNSEVSYFMTSHPDLSAARLLELVRAHWRIENGLHWVLDVTFGEDDCRIRSGHAAENLAIFRRAALNLLRDAPSPQKSKAKISLRRRRRYCLMNLDYLERVLRMTSPESI